MQTDKRGTHWAEKLGTDKAPNPSKSNTFWAEKKAEKHDELVSFLCAKGIPVPTFPWEMVVNGIGPKGNRCKYLWLHLWLCHFRKIICIVSSPNVHLGFIGILSFTVNDHLLFDTDMFPLESKYDTKTGRISNKKTIRKNWLAVGMEECSDGVVRFSQKYVDIATAQRKRADNRRNEKKSPKEDSVVTVNQTAAFAALVTVSQSLAEAPIMQTTPLVPIVQTTPLVPIMQTTSADPIVQTPMLPTVASMLQGSVDDGTNEVAVFLADKRLKRARDMHEASTEELMRWKRVSKEATEELMRWKRVSKEATEELIAASEARVRLGY